MGVKKECLFDVNSTEIQEDETELNMPSEDSGYISKPGDIWLLGEHRLMCGDCRESKAVEVLMNGRKADMCLTDPPYNVSYEGKTEDELTIDNDSMENDLFRVFLRQVFTNMFAVLKDGAPAYIFQCRQ